ncbi:hypothetical protein HNY73_003031 [Argiope bruennichi]|uniref:Uncharacterized protein n=1 Tax=Argiope bruennichi TaxID=94029 RepID=A0A8T0FVN0_ARGBR|nr:hypothetical protein HNY73_003031 [Argiope bruennichi]
MDEKDNFLIEANVVLQDVYLDDILTGCSSLPELELLKTELILLFKSAGRSLHKWYFSHANSEFPDLNFEKLSDETVRTLGVLWNSSSDTICFKVSLPPTYLISTKRDALSQITRLFDPLGLLRPVISKANFFMQKLWLLKLEWHEKLPIAVSNEWTSFVQSLPDLEKLRIPRFALLKHPERIALLGFADASEKGFAAVIYVSVHAKNGNKNCHLLCSKSRVAPLKTLSIPRLELSSCLLLSKLLNKVVAALKTDLQEITLYSDSTIVLSWIRTSPHHLKTFVTNRVAKIQELTKNLSWQHMSSENNPADLLSRGMNAQNWSRVNCGGRVPILQSL